MPHPAALAEDDRGVDEREVRECLRKVSELAVRDRVVLLGEQADVVAQVEQSLEQLARLLDVALQREHVREPERARQEHALARRQPVLDLGGPVAQNESVDDQLAPDRVDGGDEARIRRGQKADQRHQEDARVELVRVERLRERLLLLAPGAREYFSADLVAQLPPALDRPFAPELLAVANRAVERDPRHHLRVREVTRRRWRGSRSTARFATARSS